MSLTSFIKRPEVAARCKPWRPKLPRTIDIPLRAAPRTHRNALVGMAFDFLLRCELQRRAPHAKSGPWFVELVTDMLWSAIGGSLEVAQRAHKVVENAKLAVAAFVKTKSPSLSMLTDLACHAIRLGKLEAGACALVLDPHFEEVDPADVEDLLELLAIVPFDSLVHTTMILNPTFGESSMLVDGADGDLITGDMLVDFKTTKANKMNVKQLDQLLGYLVLARHERAINPAFPDINRVGLYFCRHGYLWTVDANQWSLHPEFHEFEKWFVQYAKELSANVQFRPPAPSPQWAANWPGCTWTMKSWSRTR